MERDTQSKTASWLNVLAGIWLIISPFVLHFTTSAATTNNIIFGIIVGILALIRAFSTFQTKWVSWLNVLAGIWLIISPFVLHFTSNNEVSNNIILGIIVGVLALWNGISIGTMSQGQRHAHA